MKTLLNWQKYAPQTDQLEAKDREMSYWRQNWSWKHKKGSSMQENGATARSLQHEHVRTLILSCLTRDKWTAGETQSDQFIPLYKSARCCIRVPPSPCHSTVELYKAKKYLVSADCTAWAELHHFHRSQSSSNVLQNSEDSPTDAVAMAH